MTDTVPHLATKRLTLGPLASTDAPAIAVLMADGRVARTTARIPHPYREADARAWIARPPDGGTVFAIRDGAGRIAGCCGIEAPSGGGAEIGYWLGVPYWGRGLATEAVGALAGYALSLPGIDVLTAGYFADNPASGRVLAKCGFAAAGTGETYCAARGVAVATILMRLAQPPAPPERL